MSSHSKADLEQIITQALTLGMFGESIEAVELLQRKCPELIQIDDAVYVTPCPHCGAQPDELCRDGNGWIAVAHPSRKAAVR